MAILTKNEITELWKGVHYVDLDESFQTHIYLQNFVSIQPRTSPLKFAASRDGVERVVGLAFLEAAVAQMSADTGAVLAGIKDGLSAGSPAISRPALS